MTFPLATLAPTISATGITAPTYSDIYQSLQASFKAIYGTDSYIDPDSQDGQLLAVFAKAISDANNATIAAYNSFSPLSAQGVGLSQVVKINGISRLTPTNSTVSVTLTGTVGSVITSGQVGDTSSNTWNLPSTVTIGAGGTVTVTATASKTGAIAAGANTITKILTPTLGWNSVTNPTAATVGNPVETDAALRQRQTSATAFPSKTVLANLLGAIQSITGVTQAKIYENDTGITDANGVAPHTIAAIVLGGSSATIAAAIQRLKTPGCGTQGNTTVNVTDSSGYTNAIKFYVPTAKPIKALVHIKALAGYVANTTDTIQQSVVDYINALGIGQSVYIGKLFLPAELFGGPLSNTFQCTQIEISFAPAAVGSSDLTIAYNEIATAILADVSVAVTL